MSKRREMNEQSLVEERKQMAIRDAENEWSGLAGDEKIKIVSLNGNATNGSAGFYHQGAISSSSSSSIVSRSSINNERDIMIANLDDSLTNQDTAIQYIEISKTSTSRSNSASNIRSSSLGIKQQSIGTENRIQQQQQSLTSKKSILFNGGANILEDNLMSFIGVKSLEILDTKLEPYIINQVQIISFSYIEFDDLTRYFVKIRTKFSYTTGVIFSCCNLKSFNQMDSLAEWKRLDSVTIHKKDNPISDISFWRYYLINRLSQLQLKKINNQPITAEEINTAEKLFFSVRNLAICLPEYRLSSILGNDKRKLIKQAQDQSNFHICEINQARETISKAVIQEHVRSIKSKQLMRSNSMGDISMHSHQIRPRTAGNVVYSRVQKSTNLHAGCLKKTSSSYDRISGILRSVYSDVAYNDLKLRKIDQARDVLWSNFFNSCMASWENYDAYLNKLCKKHQIFLI